MPRIHTMLQEQEFRLSAQDWISIVGMVVLVAALFVLPSYFSQ
jgi:hypothetical protein